MLGRLTLRTLSVSVRLLPVGMFTSSYITCRDVHNEHGQTGSGALLSTGPPETALGHWKTGARIYRPSFHENKPKTLVFSHTNERFGLVFAKTGSIILGKAEFQYKTLTNSATERKY